LEEIQVELLPPAELAGKTMSQEYFLLNTLALLHLAQVKTVSA